MAGCFTVTQACCTKRRKTANMQNPQQAILKNAHAWNVSAFGHHGLPYRRGVEELGALTNNDWRPGLHGGHVAMARGLTLTQPAGLGRHNARGEP